MEQLMTGDADLFDKASSYGDSGVSIKYKKKVKDRVTLNVGISGVSTLGLENELVSATWVGHDGGVDDVVWIDTANIQMTGKTSFIVDVTARYTILKSELGYCSTH